MQPPDPATRKQPVPPLTLPASPTRPIPIPRANTSGQVSTSPPFQLLHRGTSTTAINPLTSPVRQSSSPSERSRYSATPRSGRMSRRDYFAEFIYAKIFQIPQIVSTDFDAIFITIVEAYNKEFEPKVSYAGLSGRLKWLSPEEGASYFADSVLKKILRVEINPEELPEKSVIWRMGTLFDYLQHNSFHPIAQIFHLLEKNEIDRETAYSCWSAEVHKLIGNRSPPRGSLSKLIVWVLLRAKPGARFNHNEICVNFKSSLNSP